MRADFYLYFPSQQRAERAAETLRSEGYAVVTRLGADETNWLALASLESPRRLSPGDLDAIEERLFALAGSLGGDYDGFERDV
ncbi:MAG: ribonuclease E inhibitor RraB [Actinomycetota bacterium]|nr:ribonuclease E inhibitor RraB [Actinomycetota bacterium]